MKKITSLILGIVLLVSFATGCSLGDKKFLNMTEGCLEVFVNQDVTKLKDVMEEKDATETLKQLKEAENGEAKAFAEGLGVDVTQDNINKMQEVIRQTYAKTKYKIGEVSKENKTAIVNVDIYGINFEQIVDETANELEAKIDQFDNMQNFFDEFVNLISQKVQATNNLETPIAIQAKYIYDKGQYSLDDSEEYTFLDKVSFAALGDTE